MNMYFIKNLFFGLSFLLLACSVGKNISPNTEGVLQTYIDKISESQLKQNLEIIASDEMEGRDTGSEGQKKRQHTLLGNMKKQALAIRQKPRVGFKTFRQRLC